MNKALKEALKKVPKLKSNKKSTQHFAQKSEFTQRRTQKSAPSQKSELKKVYPLKKVNSRRAPIQGGRCCASAQAALTEKFGLGRKF